MTTTPSTRFDAYPDERETIARRLAMARLTDADRAAISARGADLVRAIRGSGRPGLMEVFLAEYGLSTEEGIALMCLAEALLRVPDAETIDALIEDKIAPSDWGKHLGHSSSSLVNASTWALMLTGRVLDDEQPGIAGALRGAVKRLGEPVIRAAARQAMREMGQQFVLGEDMPKALARAKTMEAKGYTYSYDMLGEAAMTAADAERYLRSYAGAIAAVGKAATGSTVAERPGVSVKLSALHPRYEVAQRERALAELTPRIADLAAQAAALNIGLNIDAEEADRLELSFDVIEAALADTRLEGWDGFGIVVQGYGLRSADAIEHIHGLAAKMNRRLMVRLVKGAYWDTEIKRAQVAGLDRFPVFTSKQATDVSYLGCARQLLGMTDRIYPQFATHNAHTTAAILHMSDDLQAFEFQRLHGMGEQLHDILKRQNNTRCRIYAPVGAHRDLLAYLVRRLLENGANSSFVNQVVDESVPPEVVASDPIAALDHAKTVKTGREIFLPARANSKGWDLGDGATLIGIDAARAPFRSHRWSAGPLIDGTPSGGPSEEVKNPAQLSDIVGDVRNATADDVDTALAAARTWDASGEDRAAILNRAADLYEAEAPELFALLAREAGKTLGDAAGEVREAVDFLRYYASRIAVTPGAPVGIVTCISPWNFPLAIFTGQIAGALAAGCGVLAKPAEQTPLVAHRAIELMHAAGVPRAALQFLPGDGAVVGRALTSDPRVGGVAFTGSTETAKLIRRAMAENLDPSAPLVAETGGINAMIVDSTALPEQAVRDVVASAFRSAGQRCSALRCLYVQEDIAKHFREMLYGAMDELKMGDPWDLSTDVGPLIDAEARDGIADYLKGRKIARALTAPEGGHFLAPTVIEVKGLRDIEREVFGPVLHLATFKATEIDKVFAEIDASGYGLTFGLHSRIDERVQDVLKNVHAGNIYVNRNQIGAVVGSQPFGGEGLSGTGPKAGGPDYVSRFLKADAPKVAGSEPGTASGPLADRIRAAAGKSPAPVTHDLPGPTGETNRLTDTERAPFLCLGPGEAAVAAQVKAIEAAGGRAVAVPEALDAATITSVEGIGGVVWWGDEAGARGIAAALARRDGAILPLITGVPRRFELRLERHLCVDTTAAGGNAALLAEAGA